MKNTREEGFYSALEKRIFSARFKWGDVMQALEK